MTQLFLPEQKNEFFRFSRRIVWSIPFSIHLTIFVYLSLVINATRSLQQQQQQKNGRQLIKKKPRDFSFHDRMRNAFLNAYFCEIIDIQHNNIEEPRVFGYPLYMLCAFVSLHFKIVLFCSDISIYSVFVKTWINPQKSIHSIQNSIRINPQSPVVLFTIF